MKKLFFYVLFGLLLLQANGQTKQIPVYLDDSKPMEVRIEDALSRMTLEEKIAMIHACLLYTSRCV